MDILNDWKVYVILYVFLSVAFNQSYKICTRFMKKSSALTILLQLTSSIFCILVIPLFKFKLPRDISVYIFLSLAIIFYTLNNRLSTISRSGVEASTYSVIKQLPTVFMIFAGILFFKEPFVIEKTLGAFLIVFSNVLVFYKKGVFTFNKFVLFGVIANLCMAIGMFIDVNYSGEFNLALYILLIMFIPSILIFIVEKVKVKDIINEYKNGDKFNIFITSFSWTFMMIVKIKAYNLGEVVVVAPLCSLAVILSIILGYFFLNEKDNLMRKVIASILILIGIVLINI